MAKPNVYTAMTAVYNRLNGDLVSTYAKGVWSGHVSPGEMPTSSEKPLVVVAYSFERDPTFTTDDGWLNFDVWIVQHVDATPADRATVVGRIIGDGSTYGLLRWTPTISGIGTNPIEPNGQEADGPYDDQHVAAVVPFRVYLAEGS